MNKVVTLSLVIMLVNHIQASQPNSSSSSSSTMSSSSSDQKSEIALERIKLEREKIWSSMDPKPDAEKDKEGYLAWEKRNLSKLMALMPSSHRFMKNHAIFLVWP